MTAEVEEAADRRLGGLLLIVLVLTCLVRFFGLELDPPYGIVTDSGVFITDEGWYTKSAQSLARHGEWRHAMDRNIYSHTPLFTVLVAAAFGVLGVSLVAARLVAVLSFVASLGCFYLLCRSAQPRLVALITALMVSVTLHVVAFSRVAIAEPVGVAFSLAALLIWQRYGRSTLGCCASLLVATLAVLVKLAFIFTLGTVAVLVLAEALGLRFRDRDSAPVFSWAPRASRLAACAVMLAVAAGALLAVRAGAGEDWSDFQNVAMSERQAELTLAQVLRNERGAITSVVPHPDRVVLVLATVGGLLCLVLPGWPDRRRRARRLLLHRTVLAMALWAAVGFVLFSAFSYQVPRYYYYLLFPLALLAVQSAGLSASRRRWPLAAAMLLLVHLGVQLPDYGRWWQRGADDSYARAGRDIAGRVTARGQDAGLLGLNASFISLFDERIRPIELRYVEPELLCRRIEWWRPPFFLHYAAAPPEHMPRCRQILRLEQVCSYQVMDGWYWSSELVLSRILYRGDGS